MSGDCRSCHVWFPFGNNRILATRGRCELISDNEAEEVEIITEQLPRKKVFAITQPWFGCRKHRAPPTEVRAHPLVELFTSLKKRIIG